MRCVETSKLDVFFNNARRARAMDMKYLSNKNTAYVSVMAVMLLGLSACGGGSTPAATTGGGTTSGGATACIDIPGEPDIMGQITYTLSTAKVGDTVTIRIPIDAETAYVGAELGGINSSTVVGGSSPTLASGTGYVTVPSLGVQTIDVSMTIPLGSGPGSYAPVINLCTADLGACKEIGGSGGVAVNYAFNPIALSAPLQRFKYFSGGSKIDPSFGNLPVDSCVDTPVLTVTAP